MALCAIDLPEKTAHTSSALLETAIILHGMNACLTSDSQKSVDLWFIVRIQEQDGFFPLFKSQEMYTVQFLKKSIPTPWMVTRNSN